MAATYSCATGLCNIWENDADSGARSEPIDERSHDVTQTDVTHALLTSDFYSFQDLLTPGRERARHGDPGVPGDRGPADRRRLLGPRRVPRAPHPARSASSGCSGRCGRRRSGSRTARVYRGWVALELSRVDAGFSTFIGVQNGLTMGAIGVGGSPEQRAELLPPMSRGELVGALRPHRAAVRLRHRARPAHHRAPHRRHLGAQRRQALDRQRHVRGPHGHLGAGHRRRPGEGLHRPPRHPRVHRHQDRAQAGAAVRAERRHPARRGRGRPRPTGCRTSTRSATSPPCSA